MNVVPIHHISLFTFILCFRFVASSLRRSFCDCLTPLIARERAYATPTSFFTWPDVAVTLTLMLPPWPFIVMFIHLWTHKRGNLSSFVVHYIHGRVKLGPIFKVCVVQRTMAIEYAQVIIPVSILRSTGECIRYNVLERTFDGCLVCCGYY